MRKAGEVHGDGRGARRRDRGRGRGQGRHVDAADGPAGREQDQEEAGDAGPQTHAGGSKVPASRAGTVRGETVNGSAPAA
ncbi:MAG: hypothetical protein E6J55_03280 [Deltaproteobacteria bacterium]|nr:MAG: hypothetical protein E6J55_03280 [Deltaproteobacteria bacterium]